MGTPKSTVPGAMKNDRVPGSEGANSFPRRCRADAESNSVQEKPTAGSGDRTRVTENGQRYHARVLPTHIHTCTLGHRGHTCAQACRPLCTRVYSRHIQEEVMYSVQPDRIPRLVQSQRKRVGRKQHILLGERIQATPGRGPSYSQQARRVLP